MGSVAKIQEELVSTEAQLAQLRKLSPSNPQIAGMESRADTLRHAISSEASKVTSANGSFSARAPEFERLTLDSVFAIEKVRGPQGREYLQLQYSQTALLNFRGLSFPHVTVGTLVKAF